MSHANIVILQQKLASIQFIYQFENNDYFILYIYTIYT